MREEHGMSATESLRSDQLVERAAQHDVGLALEPGDRINNSLAVSNKLLAYLLAGLPTVVTSTEGQRDISVMIPTATRVYQPGDVQGFLEGVRSLVESPGMLREARAAAERAAVTTYCWDHERQKLIDAVDALLPRTHHSSAVLTT